MYIYGRFGSGSGLDGAGPESAQVTIYFFNYDEYRLRTRDLD